jgi:hypothetical protein
MGHHRLSLKLVLDLGSEPVCGEVGRADGELQSFTGYASLIATLQSIATDWADGPSPDLAGQLGTSGDGAP